jgi:hypothetical protein
MAQAENRQKQELAARVAAAKELAAKQCLEEQQRQDDGRYALGSDQSIQVVRGFGYLLPDRVYRTQCLVVNEQDGLMYWAHGAHWIRHLDRVQIQNGKVVRSLCQLCGAVPARLDQLKSGQPPDGRYTVVAIFLDQVKGKRYVLDWKAFVRFWKDGADNSLESRVASRVISDVRASLRTLGPDSEFVRIPAYYQKGQKLDWGSDALALKIESVRWVRQSAPAASMLSPGPEFTPEANPESEPTDLKGAGLDHKHKRRLVPTDGAF